MNQTLTYHHPLGSPYPSLTADKSNQPETKLIARAQRGDLEAFNELILLYQDAVYRQACWLLGDEESAKDLTQEAFLIAYRKLFTFFGGSFRAWLLKIATNLCLDLIRARKRHPTIPLEKYNEDGEEVDTADWLVDPGDTPEQLVERAETRSAIARCIKHLTPEHRTVILLVDLQEMDYQEAARILGIPIGTVKSRLARARTLVQHYFQSASITGRSSASARY
jgi:RNA polymerase sigma-70 factor (ECF subfamily)